MAGFRGDWSVGRRIAIVRRNVAVIAVQAVTDYMLLGFANLSRSSSDVGPAELTVLSRYFPQKEEKRQNRQKAESESDDSHGQK